MNKTAGVSPSLSLSALRGALGEVVGAGDVGCWDRVVSVWRIFCALDRLIAVLWGIVHRLRAGEVLVGVDCSAGAVVAAPVRRRVVARVRAVAGRRVLTGAVASVGRVRRYRRARVRWALRGRGLAWRAPGLAVRGHFSSEVGRGAGPNCVLIVTI